MTSVGQRLERIEGKLDRVAETLAAHCAAEEVRRGPRAPVSSRISAVAAVVSTLAALFVILSQHVR